MIKTRTGILLSLNYLQLSLCMSMHCAKRFNRLPSNQHHTDCLGMPSFYIPKITGPRVVPISMTLLQKLTSLGPVHQKLQEAINSSLTISHW